MQKSNSAAERKDPFPPQPARERENGQSPFCLLPTAPSVGLHDPRPFSIRPPQIERERRLVDEAENLAGDVLATGLLVVHDTGRGRLSNTRRNHQKLPTHLTRAGRETHKDDEAERTRREEEGDPLLNVRETDVEAGPGEERAGSALSCSGFCTSRRKVVLTR